MILPQKKDGAEGFTAKSDAQGGRNVPECERGTGSRRERKETANKPASAERVRVNQPQAAPRITTPTRPLSKLPGNPFCRLEELIIEGLDCLGQSPSNVSGAAKCLAAAETAAIGKVLPERLNCRLRFFKDSLERIRKDLTRGCTGREPKPAKPLPQQPPMRKSVPGALPPRLPKEAPDSLLHNELENLRRKVDTLENSLQQRRTIRNSGNTRFPVRLPRTGWQAVALLLAGGGLLIAGTQWLNRPSSGEVAEVNVKVVPANAELFTNGVAVGNQGSPIHLLGVSGQKMRLEARSEGYSNLNRTLFFPSSGRIANETFELQPLPATLVVQSEPRAHDVWVRAGGKRPLKTSNAVQGIALNPGAPVEISVAVAEYEPVSRTLPALLPGERRVVDFGELSVLPATLHPKIEPQGANFSVIYPGRDPISFGTNASLHGLTPKVPFQLVAERAGYFPVTNTFTLNPGQVNECDLGRLQPRPASLRVLALPQPFELHVRWDGQARNFGAAGEANGLPAGKPLVVTVAAEGCEEWSTNLVLEPAESRTLALGHLAVAQGYLLVKAEPATCTISYRVDGGMETVIGATDTIPSLPLGHQVTVTVGKPGYLSITKSCLFEHSGELLEFGTLNPSLIFLSEQLHKAAQSGDVAGMEKILTKYSTEYPLLIDQPSPDEGDGPTPLLTAVRKGQDKVVDYLVQAGADVNRPNRFRVTPLFEAARKGNVAIVKKLLLAHADVRSKNLSGQTPIFAVVLSSHNVEIANLLLAFGADPNVRDLSGETPVLLAEENHTEEILQALEHPPQMRGLGQ